MLQAYLFIYLGQLFISLPDVPRQAKQHNNPPVVTMKLNPATISFQKNQTISYQIEVNDPEDGTTRFEEINPQEILLQVTQDQLPGSQKKQPKAFEHPAIPLLIKNGCLNCHTSRGKLIGPSFDRIASRYQPDTETVARLTRNIRNGTTGNWGELIMPSNPDVEEKDLEVILTWILEQKPGKKEYVLFGASGQITFGAESERYYLMATYLDHGPGSQLRGTCEIELARASK
jgi:cytochrome c